LGAARGSGGKGLVIGPQATDEELHTLSLAILKDPRGWIAQRVVQLSTSPTSVGDRLAPRHVDLRPFAVNDGTDIWVVPGGLTRVALPEGSLVVNSSQGGGSKDTWVLADLSTPAEGDPDAEPIFVQAPVGEHALDRGPWQDQQQQQQQGATSC